MFLERKEVRERFLEEFPKPLGPSQIAIVAPPLSTNYSLTGTAFDYLLRWYIKKLVPWAVERRWVAESALSVPIMMQKETALRRAERITLDAREAYSQYLNTRNQDKPGKELIVHAIKLAQLDLVRRLGIIDESIFREIRIEVVEDLTGLLDIVKPEDFLAQKTCVLNPTFGKASRLVGGADGDLLIDKTLIDIKTIKDLGLDRRDLNQLLGYYFLSRIGGIDGCSRQHRITSIAVYFSRYAVLLKIPVQQCIDEKKLALFLRWFEKTAKSVNVDSTPERKRKKTRSSRFRPDG